MSATQFGSPSSIQAKRSRGYAKLQENRPKEKKMDAPQTAAQTVSRLAEKISYEEYLELDLDAWTEWVDGEIIFLPMASENHQDLVLFLSALLRHYAEFHQLGKAYCEPFSMKTGPDLPGRSPDALFVSQQNLHRIEKQCVRGPADLVVEIVSPDSLRRDRVEKFGEYQKGGVREYWLIDPKRKRADFFALSEQGLFQPLPLEEGVMRSRVLQGLWLKPEWLWQNPLPPLMDVLRHWGLVG